MTVAVAFGEASLGPAEPGDDSLARNGAHADGDLVPRADGMQQVAVELATGDHARFDDVRKLHRRAPVGRMRGEQRMGGGVPHNRVEGA
jgi:hypothetical protein